MQRKSFLARPGLPVLLLAGWGTLMLPPAMAAGSAAAGSVFLWLALMLLAARLAMLVERIGMPAVLGELLAGIVLGNLSLAGIHLFDAIEQDPVIAVFAELGVVILMLQIGLETSLDSMRKVGARALAVAVLGAAVPFALGVWLVGPLVLPQASFHAHLFLGAALTATSVGITAAVFRELGLLQGPEARVILGAAIIDDVLGLVVLAVVTSLVQTGTIQAAAVALIIAKAVLFLAGAILLGRLLAPRLAQLLARIHAGVAMQLGVVMVVGLALAWLAHQAGLAAIVGAFAAGMALERAFAGRFERPALERELQPLLAALPAAEGAQARAVLDRHAARQHEELLEPVGHVFVPIFFVFTGMQVRLEALASPGIVAIALVVTLTAIAGKLVAGLVAGPVRRWLVGWGMVPRGEVGLIFAMVGRQAGVLDEALFSVIVVMVMLTTLLAPVVIARLGRAGSSNPTS